MWTDETRDRYKDDGRRYPSDLTDAEWQTIEPVLCSYAGLFNAAGSAVLGPFRHTCDAK